MLNRPRECSYIVVLFLGMCFPAWPSSPAPIPSVAAVSQLSHAEAARQLPADFEATVTYFRSYEKTLFVQDGESAIYVSATTDQPLVPGDRVRVRGVTNDSFRPIVVSNNVKLLHHGIMPPAALALYPAMIESVLDCRYVMIRGRVISADMAGSSGRTITAMELAMDGGYVGVTIDSADAGRLDGILDAEVEMRGVVSGRFDGKMQQTGLLLHVPGFEKVTILRHAAVGAWSTAITPMDQVLHAYSVQDRSRRVRVQGILTYYHEASMAVLQDGTRSIRVLTPQISPLRVGDRVEAIGFPFADNDFLTLKLGEIRSMGSAAPIIPQPVDWDGIASGRYAFDLISMEGKVVTQVRENGQDVYIIGSGEHLFSAILRHPYVRQWSAAPAPPPPLAAIRPGSTVRATGVALLEDGNPYNGPIGFRVLLRSSDDVAVLASPSWLTVANLVRVVALLMTVILLVTLWLGMLARKVRGQAAELAARAKAEAALERRRSRILEDINAAKPLPEILAQIAELVSSTINGVPCWIETAKGEQLGHPPVPDPALEVLRQQILARSGVVHGTVAAALAAGNMPESAPEALAMGANLALVAIETNGLYADLVHRSEFDLLTEIHNRFSLEKRLDTLIEAAASRRQRFGLLYIDLDGFKQVNDVYGHRIGDLYLQGVCNRMKCQLRPGDVLARLGGDEFAALVPVVHGRADLEEVAARLEHSFDKPLRLEDVSIAGTASIGLALYPDDGKTRDALLSAADSAMYAIKHGRRIEATIGPGTRSGVAE